MFKNNLLSDVKIGDLYVNSTYIDSMCYVVIHIDRKKQNVTLMSRHDFGSFNASILALLEKLV